jgi:Rrf2 family cysteine metabolism transcriptional repressor
MRSMSLSSRSRYTIRMLLDLGLHEKEGLIHLKDIAQRQKIPLSYLENLIAPLQTRGILKTALGPRGGVCLSKYPEEINLNDVIEIMDGPIAPADCLNNPESYPDAELCALRDIWNEVRQAAQAVLVSKTLQELVSRQRKKIALNQPEDSKLDTKETVLSEKIKHKKGANKIYSDSS